MRARYAKFQSTLEESQVLPGTGNLAGIWPDHGLSLNTQSDRKWTSTVRESWKEPREGSEIEPEIINLQAVGGLCIPSGMNGWRRTFCIMDQRVIMCCKLKLLWSVGVGKPSLNRANIVAHNRPETTWSIHGQVEAYRKISGGPNPLSLKRFGMSCGSEWKASQTWQLLVLPEIVLGLASRKYRTGVELLNRLGALPGCQI